MRGLGWPDADVEALGRFLRESNSGRSLDCLPQGIHPCKVLGAEFLRFVDNSYKLKCSFSARFLDDIHLFGSDESQLLSDLISLQQLLGEKGLSLNDAKTEFGSVGDVDLPQTVDAMKQSLLRIRRHVIDVSGVDTEVEALEHAALSQQQVEYLLNLLETPDIDESDAELVLVLLRDHAAHVIPRMLAFLAKFPGLTKAVYHYARLATERAGFDELLVEFLCNSPNATEYQLFWIVKLAEDFLHQTPKYGDILAAALEHDNATILTRAKVLEIAERRFGLPERREEVLRSGRSDWEAWAAAAGSRSEPAAGRNHLLTYFAKGSPLNALISDCVRGFG